MFGGSPGILDEGKLESAVYRARNLFSYNREATIYDLAASIGWGIAKNHPFVDGNKRTAFVVMAVFLQINGVMLTATEVDVVTVMLGVAAGEIAENQLSHWLKNNSKSN
ncbi:MAG: type II toxin-antitoxin system death-on-curing family toxin [Xenococcaceae cyanobacterium]